MPTPSTFTVACPACQAEFRVPASLAGRTTDCPRCKQAIIVPAALGDSETRSGQPPSLPPARRRLDDDDDRYDEDDDGPRRRRRSLEPDRGQTILILGILSLFMAQFILGPIAWYMGNEDLRKMREGRMETEGKSNTQTGRLLGIIATSYSLALVVLCCSGFVLMVALRKIR